MSRTSNDEPAETNVKKRTLRFEKNALKEWKKLPKVASESLKKKLKKALENGVPTGESLRGYTGYYRLKMKRPNYRLVYRWEESGDITVTVVVVEPRETVYKTMKERLSKRDNT